MNVPNVFTVVVVGIGLVFAVLAVLVLILWLEGKVFGALDKKRADKAHAVARSALVVPVPQSQSARVAPPQIESGIPPEVVAAITAAIAAMDGGKYTLRSLVRKKEAGNPWGVAATISYTEPF